MVHILYLLYIRVIIICSATAIKIRIDQVYKTEIVFLLREKTTCRHYDIVRFTRYTFMRYTQIGKVWVHRIYERFKRESNQRTKFNRTQYVGIRDTINLTFFLNVI